MSWVELHLSLCFCGLAWSLVNPNAVLDLLVKHQFTLTIFLVLVLVRYCFNTWFSTWYKSWDSIIVKGLVQGCSLGLILVKPWFSTLVAGFSSRIYPSLVRA